MIVIMKICTVQNKWKKRKTLCQDISHIFIDVFVKHTIIVYTRENNKHY